jgi:hypothetical protein
MLMRSFIIRIGIGLFFCLSVISWYLIPDHFFINYSQANDLMKISESQKNDEKKKEEIVQQEKMSEKNETEIQSSIKQNVPFVVQAPHAQWDDPQFQDACEEASMIMVDAWIKNERNVSKNDAEEMMYQIFEKEEEMFDSAIDTSATDTGRFIAEYFGHSVEMRENITMEGIYEALSQGYVIIAPTNGKMLQNPHFSDGGPERHMLVIIGYDRDNREFVTNDPGTRVGRGYKYKDTTLYNAIRDYETGVKKEIVGTNKNVILIKK